MSESKKKTPTFPTQQYHGFVLLGNISKVKQATAQSKFHHNQKLQFMLDLLFCIANYMINLES